MSSPLTSPSLSPSPCPSSSSLSSLSSSLPPSPVWTIQPVTPCNINEVVTFINQARHKLFPNLQLKNAPLPNDVARTLKRGVFLTARANPNTTTTTTTTTCENGPSSLIAVIGYVPYDNRFPQLSFDGQKTVEVVRLFVAPEYRRCGLAAALFHALKQRAEDEGVHCLYLHTHPFLPGAIRFWQKMGFWISDVEDDPVWRTTHMQMLIGEGDVAP